MLLFRDGGENLLKLVDINKKVEKVVVGGFNKIEDKFVDTFLKKDDETTLESKERIVK